jgi:hypothetical protein
MLFVFNKTKRNSRRRWNISSYLGSMITNNARCTREIKSWVVVAKAAFNKEKLLFTSKVTLN